jgi:hypothetical protein
MRKFITRIVPIILVFFTSIGYSQTIENLTYKVEGNQIRISYDLIGDAGELYEVTIYSSADNFTDPITSANGDIGPDVSPGRGKVVMWDAKSDLGEYRGSLSLNVKAELITFVNFKSIAEGQKIKKGTNFEILWEGGPQGNIKLELYNGTTKVSDLGETINSGKYTWALSKSAESGKTFRIRASSGERAAFSPQFKISGKMPIWMIAAPVVVVGGVAAIVAGGGGGGGGGDNPENEPISDPLLPGNN